MWLNKFENIVNIYMNMGFNCKIFVLCWGGFSLKIVVFYVK